MDAHKTQRHLKRIRKMGITEFADDAVTIYSLLAIMDKLARRCPDTHLENYRVNGYRLLFWLKQSIAQIDNPAIYDRLRQICSYLTPDIDLANISDDEELF